MDVITFPVNRLTTSGLQILLHGVISLPDATSYDKSYFHKQTREDPDLDPLCKSVKRHLYEVKVKTCT